jgi:hypothetical protein
MRASKPLASVVAAAAVVGAIGLAYAQDTSTTTPSTPADQTLQNQGSTSPSTSPSTSTDMAVTPTERPAQADRN